VTLVGVFSYKISPAQFKRLYFYYFHYNYHHAQALTPAFFFSISSFYVYLNYVD
jgi:hypothetical protein